MAQMWLNSMVEDTVGKRLNTVGLIPLREPDGALTKVRWTDLNPFQQRLAQQLCELLGLPDALGAETVSARAAAAFEILKGLRPQDELEGLYVVQMLATYDAAITCFRHAARSEVLSDRHHRQLLNGHRLMTLFLKQRDVLDRQWPKNNLPEPHDPSAALAAINAEFEELLRESLDPSFHKERTEV
jgi:hypothetical protein